MILARAFRKSLRFTDILKYPYLPSSTMTVTRSKSSFKKLEVANIATEKLAKVASKKAPVAKRQAAEAEAEIQPQIDAVNKVVENEDASTKPAKKQKKTKDQLTKKATKAATATAAATATTTKIVQIAPKNNTMPTDYSFIEPKPEGCLKIVSFNVNSLNASLKKGFKEYVKAEDPDILCIQETKLNDDMAFLYSKDLYPTQVWNKCTAKKGYSGTAIFSKINPISKAKKIGIADFDSEGRTIMLEFEKFYLVACYVPNSGAALERLPLREQWDKKLNEYITTLELVKPVILTGDLNVSHQEIDLARPDTNHKSAGFTKQERDGFSELLATNNRTDTLRHLHPTATTDAYSYYSYRFACRSKLIGWRLDYFVVSQQLLPNVVDSFVRTSCYGASDHLPIVLYAKNLV